MAVYNKSGNAINLDGFHNYAVGELLPQRFSSFYSRLPFFTYITGKANNTANLGRPASGAIIGNNLSPIDMQMGGGTEITQRLQTGTVGGFKWLGLRDTSASTGNDSQDQHNATATWRWARAQQPITIWNSTVLASKPDKYKIADALREAVEEATEQLFTNLNLAYLRGNPTSQSADVWDSPLGVLQAMDTDNTYANLDRASVTSWASNRVTTAKPISLSLIDDANITQGAQDKGPGIDFVLVGKANYLKLKGEALARGQSVTVGDMPEASKVGVKQECIKYGNVTITYDPTFTGNWSSYDSDVTDATKLMLCFTSDSWKCYFHPDGNFKVFPFHDESERAGGPDCVTSRIQVMTILRCAKPWQNVAYTNAS